MSNQAPPTWFLLVFLGIWSSVTLIFDGLIGWSGWHQARTAWFAQTDGILTRCELKSQRGSKGGTTYTLDVAYDYDVDGRRYTGTRYMYGQVGTNDGTWQQAYRELMVNKPVTVYYDPADPADAVLRPGLTGMHLFMAWFLTPFNIVMLWGWAYLFRGRRRSGFDPDDRRYVESTMTGAAVRLPGLGRVGVFAGTLLAVTFIGIFVIGFGFGFDPPTALLQWAFIGAFGLAALAVLAWGKPKRLEIDDIAQVIRLPGRDAIPFADVREVTVEERRLVGEKGRVMADYPCLLRLTDVDAAPVEVATYTDRAHAEALAAWLRERLGLAG